MEGLTLDFNGKDLSPNPSNATLLSGLKDSFLYKFL